MWRTRSIGNRVWMRKDIAVSVDEGRFGLLSEVDASNVQAEFKNGVPNVHLPKSATAKLKAIAVKVS